MSKNFDLSLSTVRFAETGAQEAFERNTMTAAQAAEERTRRVRELEQRLFWEDENAMKASDRITQGASYLESGAGHLLHSVGALGHAAETKSRELLGLDPTVAPNALIRGGEHLMKRAEDLRGQTSGMYQEMLADSTPSGDITKPSTWSLGERPTVEGLLTHVIGSAIEEAPVYAAIAAATVLTKGAAAPTGMAVLNQGARSVAATSKAAYAAPAVGAVVGGAQAGGNQGYESVERLRNLGLDELLGESPVAAQMFQERLEQRLPTELGNLRELLGSDPTPEEASGVISTLVSQIESEVRNSLESSVRTESFVTGGASGLVGGALLGKLFVGKGAGITKKVAGAAVIEGGQEVAEGMGGRFGYNWITEAGIDLTENTFAEAILGAGTGAVLGVPTALATGEETEEQQQSRVSDVELKNRVTVKSAATQEALKEVNNTGDYGSLLDPTSPEFAPYEVLQDIRARVNTGKASPEQVKEAAGVMQVAMAATEGLIQDRIIKSNAMKNYTTEEAFTQTISKLESMLADDSGNITPEQKEQIQARIQQETTAYSMMGAIQAEVEASGGIQVFEEDTQLLRKEIDAAKVLVQEVTQKSMNEVSIASLQQELRNVETGVIDTKKASDVISFAMASPQMFESEEGQLLLAEVLEDPNTPAQVKQAYSEYRKLNEAVKTAAANRDTKKVLEDIIYGDGKQFAGIQDYIRNISNALASKQTRAALNLLGTLTNFTEHHTNKANAAAQAMELVRASGNKKTWHIAPMVDGMWTVVEGELKDEKFRKDTGALNISPKAAKLVKTVQQEAALLHEATAGLNAMVQGLTSREEVVSALTPTVKAATTAAQEPVVVQDDANVAPTVTPPTTEPVEATTATEATQPKLEVSPVITKASEAGKQQQDVLPEPVNPTVGEDFSTVKTNAAGEAVNRSAMEILKDVAGRTNRAKKHVITRIKDFLNKTANNADFLKEKHVIDALKNQGVNEQLVAATAPDIQRVAASLTEIRDTFVIPVLERYNRIVEKGRVVEARKTLHPVIFDEQGKIRANFADSLAVTVYNWMSQSGFMDLSNDEESLRTFFQIDPESSLEDFFTKNPEINAAVLMKGTRVNNLLQDFGKDLKKIYGLHVSSKAPANLEKIAEGHMGVLVYTVLEDMDILQRKPIVHPNSLESRKESPEYVKDRTFDVVTLTTAVEGDRENYQLGLPLQKEYGDIGYWIVNAQDNRDTLALLFPNAIERALPARVGSEKFTRKAIKNSDRTVPSDLVSLLTALQKKEHFLNEHTVKMFKALDNNASIAENSFARLIGYKNQQELDVLIKDNREAAIKENMSIVRKMDAIRTMIIEYGDGNPFYYDRFVAKQQRVHYANGYNPQEDKVIRSLVRMGEWAQTVDMSDTNSIESLYLAFAEAAGVKTDSQSNAVSIAAGVELVSLASDALTDASLTDTFSTAVREIALSLDADEPVRNMTDSIRDVVSKWGEEMHSYQGLVELVRAAKYQNENQSLNGFTHNLWREVDGKTNGPMLALLNLAGIAGMDNLSEVMKAGGFYTEDSGVTSVSGYVTEQNGKDLYQMMATQLVGKIQEHLVNPLGGKLEGKGKREAKEKLNRVQNALTFFYGDLVDSDGNVNSKGRGFAKPVTTQTFYGAGVPSILQKMQEDLFVPAINTRFEKLGNDLITLSAAYAQANSPEAKQAAEAAYILAWENTKTAFEQLEAFTYNRDTKKPLPAYLAKLRDEVLSQRVNNGKAAGSLLLTKFYLHKSVINNVNANISFLLKHPTEELFKDFLSVFKSRTKEMTAASDVVFDIHRSMRESLIKSKEAELREKGQRLPISKKIKDGALRYTLSKEDLAAIDKQLADIAPWMHTFLSLGDKTGRSAIPIGKTDNVAVVDESLAGYVRMLNSNMRNASVYSPFVDGHTESRNVAPGVSATVLATQSMDTGIAHSRGIDDVFDLLNVHDAKIGAADKAVQFGTALNKATFVVSAKYSMSLEMLNSYKRVWKGLFELYNKAEKANDQTMLEAVKTSISGIYSTSLFNQGKRDGSIANPVLLLKKLENVAKQATKEKLEYLLQVTHVDQYTINDGAYVVTDEDRAVVQAELDKLSAMESDTDLANQIQRLNDFADYTEIKEIEITDASGFVDNALVEAAKNAVQQKVKENLDRNTSKAVITKDRTNWEAGDEAAAAISTELAQLPNGRSTVAEVLNKFNDTKVIANSSPSIAAIKKQLDRTSWANKGFGKIPVFIVDDNNAEGIINTLDSEFRVPTDVITNVLAGDDLARYLVTKDANGVTREVIVLKADGYTAWDVKEGHVFSQEQFLHESWHALTAAKITAEEQKLAAKQTKGFKQLNAVYEVSKALFGNEPGYENAFTNLQEFAAWGMTNTGLMQKLQSYTLDDLARNDAVSAETLANLRLNKNAWSRVKTLFQSMVNAIAGLISPNSNDANTQTLLSSFLFSNLTLANSRMNPAAFWKVSSRKQEVATFSMAAQPQQAQNAVAMNTVEVFDALATPQDSPQFSVRLRGYLSDLTNKVLGNAGTLLQDATQQRALRPEDVYAKSLITGRLPFANYAKGNPALFVTDQQALVIDQIEAVLSTRLVNSHATTKSLVNIFKQAEKLLGDDAFFDGDWSKATAREKAVAQEKRAAVFSREAHPDSNYLARFAALALAHPDVTKAMQKASISRQKVRNAETVMDAIEMVWNLSTDAIMGDLDKTKNGLSANQNIQRMLENLVDIEARGKNTLIEKVSATGNYIEGILDKQFEFPKRKLHEAIDRAYVESRKLDTSGVANSFIRATAAWMPAVAENRIGDTVQLKLNFLTQQNKRKGNQRLGWFPHALSEVRGVYDGVSEFTKRMIREAKVVERERMAKQIAAKENLISSFANKGVYLTKEAKAAITRGLIRTDMQSLLQSYSMAEIEGLFVDQSFVDAEKSKMYAYLNKHPEFIKEWTVAIKDLAYTKATETVSSDFLFINAEQIASLAGLGISVDSDTVAEVKNVIDQLVTLESLSYLDSKERTIVGGILEVENSRDDGGNGIEVVLRYHKHEQEEAARIEFGGNTFSLEKGYAPDILNDKMTVVRATEKEGEDLLKQGYIKGPKVTNDPTDRFNKDAPQYIYTIRNGGLGRLLTGAMSYTSSSLPRAERVNKMFNLEAGLDSLKQEKKLIDEITKAKAQLFLAAAKNPAAYDPSQQEAGRMIPMLYNRNGIVSVGSYHYVNGKEARDNLLQRNNDFSDVLSKMVGQHYDRIASQEQNESLVVGLKEQFDADFIRNREGYVEVGPNSVDASIREQYRLFSEETKAAIRKHWGQDAMYVRADVLDDVIGYRKYTLTSALQKEEAERTVWENAYALVMEAAFGKKAVQKSAMIGEVWGELIKDIRNMAVVKNLRTLVLNIVSNTSQLVLAGLSMQDSIKLQREGLANALAHRRDSAQLEELKQLQAIGIDTKELSNKITEIEVSIKNNKAAKLIEAGLMPSIVESVDMVNDPFAYKSLLDEKVSKYTDKLPDNVRSFGKNLFLTADSKTYRFMSGAAQLSDFTARYALYEHNTLNENMEESKAIEASSETFINYDVPTHVATQYLNDIGLIFYTKYYWRIQKILYQALKDKPARTLSMAAMEKYMENGMSVMGSGIHETFGNPLHTSILKYPGAFSNTLFMKPLTGLMD